MSFVGLRFAVIVTHLDFLSWDLAYRYGNRIEAAALLLMFAWPSVLAIVLSFLVSHRIRKHRDKIRGEGICTTTAMLSTAWVLILALFTHFASDAH